MEGEELWARFQALTNSESDKLASAVSTGQVQSHFLIKGSNGEPMFLLECEERAVPRAPIHLKHVQISFDDVFEVRVHPDANAILGRYTKLACSPQSSLLHQWFVELLGAITSGLHGRLSAGEIDQLISSLLEMFRVGLPVSVETVVGLWGELVAISMASDKAAFVRGWHTSPREVFDFWVDEARLEVKTTLGRTRVHDFSFEQVSTARPKDYVLSILAQRATGGSNVFSFARRLAADLPNPERVRFWRIVMGTLGPELDGIEDLCFDEKLGAQSLRLLESRSVPRPMVPDHFRPMVTNVRFSSDLSGLDDGPCLTSIGLRPRR